jgi:hypothetical protein
MMTVPGVGDASENATLWDVGATFGVYKLEYDPPHWSVDGF